MRGDEQLEVLAVALQSIHHQETVHSEGQRGIARLLLHTGLHPCHLQLHQGLPCAPQTHMMIMVIMMMMMMMIRLFTVRAREALPGIFCMLACTCVTCSSTRAFPVHHKYTWW